MLPVHARKSGESLPTDQSDNSESDTGRIHRLDQAPCICGLSAEDCVSL